jgi:YidC/Oxa1 family membrane protein insertase
MTNPTLWNQILVWPMVNGLFGIYKLLYSLHIPGALGIAIIIFTVIIRLILSPIMAKQLKSARQMANLKPKLDELTTKHKNDKQQLQQAQLQLYKEHGINPAAGCLPMLLQFPLLIALYSVFNMVLRASDMTKVVEEINSIVYHPALRLDSLDLSFFGTNLLVKPSQWQTTGYWLLLIPLITGALQYVQTKMMTNNTIQDKNKNNSNLENKKQIIKKDLKDQGKQPEKNQEDMASEMQKQMAIMTPIMFGVFAYQFPLGLSLYWNTFGIIGMIQQRLINKQLS